MRHQAWGVLVSVAVAAGCAPAPKDALRPPAQAHTGAPAAADIAGRVVLGGSPGLELHTWTITETGDALGAALHPHAQAGPALDAETAERWRRSGLRAVALPIEEVPKVFESVGVRGALDRRWLGEAVDWTTARNGRPLRGRGGVRVDDGLAHLGPGRLRLLVRDWAMPTLDGSRLRIELAVQHVASEPVEAFAPPVRREAIYEGVVLAGLSVTLVLDGSAAIVLVSETPETEWGGDASGASARAPEGADARAQAYGPRATPAPTVGEALLSDIESARAGVRERTVLVLVARPPQTLRLLP